MNWATLFTGVFGELVKRRNKRQRLELGVMLCELQEDLLAKVAAMLEEEIDKGQAPTVQELRLHVAMLGIAGAVADTTGDILRGRDDDPPALSEGS